MVASAGGAGLKWSAARGGLRWIGWAVGLAIAPPTAAGGTWSGTAGLLSDKVVYGLSQSAGKPSAVLDLAYRSDAAWSLSAGVASLGRGPRQPDAEYSLGAATAGQLSDSWAWQLAYTRVETSGAAGTRRPGYHQPAVALEWAGQLQLSAAYSGGFLAPAAAPGGGRMRVDGLITEATWHQPLARRWALDAGLGRVHYRGDALRDFGYGSLGLSWGVGPVQLFATRVFSNSRAPTAAGSRAVLALLWSF